MGNLFLSAMHRPVSAARSISLVITISTGIRSKRRATHIAWRLPSAESGVCTCWYAPCSLPSVDPCRTKYTVFISALWFAPHKNAGLSVIEHEHTTSCRCHARAARPWTRPVTPHAGRRWAPGGYASRGPGRVPSPPPRRWPHRAVPSHSGPHQRATRPTPDSTPVR
jgi:hypothetical protein